MNYLFPILMLLLSLSADGPAPKEERPNILWIVSEDNSPFLGCYGDTFATTPNIDRLAADAMVFGQAFTSAPVCAPTRFTLITGTYASAMGTAGMRSNYPIPGQIRFFPHYLQEKGYYCTNNSKKDYNTIDQPEAWHESSNKAHYSNRPKGSPFFHVMNFGRSHEGQLHTRMENLHHDPDKVPLPPYHPDTREVRLDWAQYYDLLMEMDQHVGEVIDKLKKDGLYEETIIFYYSDHGGALPRGKRFLYESGTRVPLVVRVPEKYQHLFPGYKAGGRTDQLVSFVDFAPTVLSLAGIEPPEYMMGKAFLGPHASRGDEPVFNFRERMDAKFDLGRSVRTDRYRYIFNFMPYRPRGQHNEYQWKAASQRSWEEACRNNRCNPVQHRFWEPKATEELYLPGEDPHNINNLAEHPEYQAVKDSLSGLLANWMIETRDLGLLPEVMRQGENNVRWREKIQREDYPYAELLAVAQRAAEWEPAPVETLRKWLQREEEFQYWALAAIRSSPSHEQRALLPLIDKVSRENKAAAIASIGAYYQLGEREKAIGQFRRLLEDEEMMVRNTALDQAMIFTADELKTFEAELKGIAGKDGRKRGYDIRLADYLLSRIGQ